MISYIFPSEKMCFPSLVGIARVTTPDWIDDFIIVIIFLSAASVCFRRAASLAHSSFIVGLFTSESMLAAYYLSSASDSSNPSTQSWYAAVLSSSCARMMFPIVKLIFKLREAFTTLVGEAVWVMLAALSNPPSVARSSEYAFRMA